MSQPPGFRFSVGELATTNEALNQTAQLFACQAFIKFTVLLVQQLGVNYGLSLVQWACREAGFNWNQITLFTTYFQRLHSQLGGNQQQQHQPQQQQQKKLQQHQEQKQKQQPLPFTWRHPRRACSRFLSLLPYLNSCEVQQILFQVRNFVFGNCINHLLSRIFCNGWLTRREFA